MKENETLLTVMVGAGATMLMAYSLMKNEKKKWRWWCTELYKNQTGRELMLDMKSQCVSGPVSYTHLDVYKRQDVVCV